MHGHQKSLYKTSALLYILSNLIANRRLTIDLGPGTGVLIIGYLYPPSMLSKSIIKKTDQWVNQLSPAVPATLPALYSVCILIAVPLSCLQFQFCSCFGWTAAKVALLDWETSNGKILKLNPAFFAMWKLFLIIMTAARCWMSIAMVAAPVVIYSITIICSATG